VEVATFEDEAVGAESKGEGHEEGDSEEGEPEKCEKVEGGDRNDKWDVNGKFSRRPKKVSLLWPRHVRTWNIAQKTRF